MRNKIVCTLATVLCLLCVFLPGLLLRQYSRQPVGQAQIVPEELYSALNMSMAKAASEKLSVKEKVQLVRGEWDSYIVDHVEAESSLLSFQAANMASNNLSELYRAGKYATSVASDYANWYCWSAECHKAVDAIFHTYTVYYWLITYEKYDHSEKHEIRMLEDGTIVSAYGVLGDRAISYDYS